MDSAEHTYVERFRQLADSYRAGRVGGEALMTTLRDEAAQLGLAGSQVAALHQHLLGALSGRAASGRPEPAAPRLRAVFDVSFRPGLKKLSPDFELHFAAARTPEVRMWLDRALAQDLWCESPVVQERARGRFAFRQDLLLLGPDGQEARGVYRIDLVARFPGRDGGERFFHGQLKLHVLDDRAEAGEVEVHAQEGAMVNLEAGAARASRLRIVAGRDATVQVREPLAELVCRLSGVPVPEAPRDAGVSELDLEEVARPDAWDSLRPAGPAAGPGPSGAVTADLKLDRDSGGIRLLRLTGSGVDDRTLQCLDGLAALQTMVRNVPDLRIPRRLGALSELQTLYLYRTGISDAGVGEIRQLGRLRVLRLDMTRVTDAGVAGLGSLQDLQELWLSYTRISDRALAHLASFRSLHRLHLEYTEVSDDGLRHLAALADLRELYVAGTRITRRGRTALQASREAFRIRD